MNGREKAEGAGGRRKARDKATAPVVAVSHCLHIVLGGLEPCRYGGDSAKAPEIAGFLPILAAPIFMFRACAHDRCFSITRGADHAQQRRLGTAPPPPQRQGDRTSTRLNSRH